MLSRRRFLTSSTALLATTMLVRPERFVINPVLAGAQRAQMQAIAGGYLFSWTPVPGAIGHRVYKST